MENKEEFSVDTLIDAMEDAIYNGKYEELYRLVEIMDMNSTSDHIFWNPDECYDDHYRIMRDFYHENALRNDNNYDIILPIEIVRVTGDVLGVNVNYLDKFYGIEASTFIPCDVDEDRKFLNPDFLKILIVNSINIEDLDHVS